MGGALSSLGLGSVAYWHRHALFKFIMIASIVMIICYVIVISTKMEEKHWPPVFLGGILALGGYYMLESALAPKPQSWGDYFSGMFSSDSDEYVAPVVERDPANPFYDGGRKRRPKRSK